MFCLSLRSKFKRTDVMLPELHRHCEPAKPKNKIARLLDSNCLWSFAITIHFWPPLQIRQVHMASLLEAERMIVIPQIFVCIFCMEDFKWHVWDTDLTANGMCLHHAGMRWMSKRRRILLQGLRGLMQAGRWWPSVMSYHILHLQASFDVGSSLS